MLLTGFELLAALLLGWVAPAASAHSVLLATTPATASTVTAAPASVVLTFNEMPRGEYSVIHVTGPDGARRDSGHVRVLNDTVTEQLGGSRPAGTYVVDWRVISADGHPVSGQFSFAALSAATPLAARQADVITRAAAKPEGDGVLVVGSIAGAVVVLLLGLARYRRNRHSIPGDIDA